MSIGDTISNIVSVAAGAYLNIKPPAGVEWVIHNINHEGSVELYFTDGTNYIKIDSSNGPGGWLSFAFHVTNSRWYAVKNVETTAKLISYDGIVTKG